ncbi:MAG: hypothetical protein IJV35_08510 [Neisseriaceae bacterium]|nr:hypothetical protein [Neisseriaceae bacterium]
MTRKATVTVVLRDFRLPESHFFVQNQFLTSLLCGLFASQSIDLLCKSMILV